MALAPHTTPSLPVVLSHINDNQCVLSPPVQLKSKFGDLNLVSSANKVTFQKTVNLHVVLPAVSVKGPLQKTLSFQSGNKICEQCFVCKSVSLCPKCYKCHMCCQRSTCGGPSATVLAGLALPGFKSEGSLHPQGRVPTPLQEKTTPSKISCNSQWFISSITKQKSERGLTISRSKTGYRKGVSSIVSGLLQPVIPGSKTQQKMEAHSGSKSTEPVPCSGNVQDGNHQTLPTTGGVGHFARFQRRLFSHSHKPQVAKISQVPHQRSDFSVHRSSLWPVDGSVGVHKGGQRGKTYGSISGYSNPPIPR